MVRDLNHRRELAAVWRSSLSTLLTLLLAAALALSLATPAGAARTAAAKAHRRLPYPAGATRPSRTVTRLAHARKASSSGGAAAPGSAYTPTSGASLAGVSLAKELQARLAGLNSYLDTNNSGAPEGLYTSTLAAF